MRGYDAVEIKADLLEFVRRFPTDSCLRVTHDADFFGLAVAVKLRQLHLPVPALPRQTAHIPRSRGASRKNPERAQISLPKTLLAPIRALVKEGQAKSVSNFVQVAAWELINKWLKEPALSAPPIVCCRMTHDGLAIPYGPKIGERWEAFRELFRTAPTRILAPVPDTGGPICCILHRWVADRGTWYSKQHLPKVRNLYSIDERANAIAAWTVARLEDTRNYARLYRPAPQVPQEMGFTPHSKPVGMDGVPLGLWLNAFLDLLRGDSAGMQTLVHRAMLDSGLTPSEWLHVRSTDPTLADRLEYMWMEMTKFVSSPTPERAPIH